MNRTSSKIDHGPYADIGAPDIFEIFFQEAPMDGWFTAEIPKKCGCRIFVKFCFNDFVGGYRYEISFFQTNLILHRKSLTDD